MHVARQKAAGEQELTRALAAERRQLAFLLDRFLHDRERLNERDFHRIASVAGGDFVFLPHAPFQKQILGDLVFLPEFLVAAAEDSVGVIDAEPIEIGLRKILAAVARAPEIFDRGFLIDAHRYPLTWKRSL